MIDHIYGLQMQKAFNFATFGPSSNVVSPNKMAKEVALLSKLFRILKYKLYKWWTHLI